MTNTEENILEISDLLKKCEKIDGQGYGSARNLLGVYQYDEKIIIIIDYVPKDPFSPIPGKVRIRIPLEKTKYPRELFNGVYGNLAAKHFFTEYCYRSIRYEGRPWLWMEPPGQAVLERNSVGIMNGYIELRLDFIPPFKSRRKLSGGRLKRLFSSTIPRVINNLIATNKKREFFESIKKTLEDQEFLRKKLREEGFIAFIANGSILPRRGDTDFPLPEATPFKAPERYTYEFTVPNHGVLEGLAIEKGRMVVFAGANFHGKTTILEALRVAHYNHVPGDGREFVISVDELPLIPVENRRIVRGVDISIFMRSLPGIGDTKNFTTNSASGSTSQAATLVEALECGVPGFLIDEDSSAVNFLLKDKVLKELVPKDLEPITPLIERLPILMKNYNITPIFAVGALGQIVNKADVIFLVSNFNVSDVIKRNSANQRGSVNESIRIKKRIPATNTIPNGRVREVNYDEITITWLGKRVKIDLRGLGIRKALKEKAQVRALAYAVTYASRYADGKISLSEIVDKVLSDIKQYGIDIINSLREEVHINLAMFTKYQLFYVLSRLPTLRIKD